VNDSFKLYLTTRNSFIEIAKHQRDLVSVVNFSVTKSGLEGKLLSIIITHFQPEIEREKQELLEEQEKLKINLSDLEEKLLRELADSSGNILENKGLINSLNETKQHSQVVAKSLKDSEKLQRTLD
jgi:dynein heavy chain 2, cytosolic